jgi:outer membrane biosynthesis protein TonB
MLDQDVDVDAPVIETKKPDVIISTAHKAKGLEWGRVKIGKDFKGPKKGQDGKIIMPDDDELRLAYVAVTRAEKALDPGSLSYVFAHTSENGGADEHGNILGVDAPNVDPVDAPSEPDPVNAPEPVNTPDPAPVTAPEPDPIDTPEPEPAPVEPDPVDVPAEPDPAPVAPEPTPAPVEPEPAPAPAPAPVEPDPAPAEPQPVPGYNANGYTPGEQERVDYLENLLAKVFKGEIDGDVDTIEGELDNYYTASESRLKGIDVPEIKRAPEPAPVEPVTTPSPATAPTTPTAPEPASTPARRTRTNMSGVKVHALGGEELVEGMEVRHPKYTGTVIRVIPSAGTVRIKKQDGTEVIARGHKVSVITPGAEPTPTPAVQNLAPGSAGVDPTTGLPYFVGRDGKVFQIGDTVSHAKKGEGTVKAIYVGATSVSVDWADGSNSRSQAKALYGKDGGGENSPEPTNAPSVEPVDPEPTTPEPTAPAPAPVEPEPVVPEPTAPAAPAVDPVETEPASKSKLSVKGGEIEGGDPVGKSGPVSPHGEPLPGDQTDLMMLSMLYPQGSVITYYTKTGGVKFRLKKVEGDVWHELKENGFINENAYQYIPHLSRMQMAVKPNWGGKRDSRIGNAPDNETFLNSIPIGGTVTTADHWDGKPRTWTKLAPGYWKSPDQGGAFNNSLHRYGVSDFSGIDDSFTTPDYKAEGWSEYAAGKDRALKLFKLTNGSEVSFARRPNVHYVKENGKWAEVVRGKRTGTILNTLNAESNSYSDGPAFVNVANAAEKENYVPKRVKPENIVGDPKEIDAVFGTDIDNYSGVDTLFRQYDRETSPLNALNLPPTPPRWKFADVAETTNSRGDKIVVGARAYDLQGNYIGKVKSIRHPENSLAGDGKSVELMHTPDQGIVPLNTDTTRVNPEDMTTVRTKHWDTSTDLDFSDYTRVKDIEEQMNETYGGINFQLAPRATDIRTARQLSATVSKIFNKYPQLQEAMSFVGTQPYGQKDGANAAMFASGPSEFGVTGSTTANTYEGRYGHVGARMAFNVSRSYEAFVRGKRESQKTRWNNNVDEGREVEATVTHEFGHVLDFFTGVISEEKILEFASEVLGRKVTQNNSELGQELFNNKLLSGYSLKWGNIYPVELVAESFQDVEMNGVNASPLSKLVHQELMRRLATQANASVESGISNAAPSEGVTV